MSSPRLDARLVRMLLAADGRIKRPGTAASGVLAAQLAELILADRLVDDDDGVPVTRRGRSVAPHLADLWTLLEIRPRRGWELWFWRRAGTPLLRYAETQRRMEADGEIYTARSRLGRRYVRLVEPTLAAGELARLPGGSRAEDAVVAALLTICRARSWANFDTSDLLAGAPGLTATQRTALDALLTALVADRLLAASGGYYDPPQGVGG